MIAAYVRVSSRHQRSDSQRAEITKWLENNGIDLGQVEWYEDKESGKSLARPGFERLQADIFAGKIRTLSSGSSTDSPAGSAMASTCSPTGLNAACGSSR